MKRTHRYAFPFSLLLTASALHGCADPGDASAPGPEADPAANQPDAMPAAFVASSMITSVAWNFNSKVQMAAGSDLWPLTWGSDGSVWTGWGDGGGFQGADHVGRVSVGFAKITGTPPNVVGTNIWGASPTFAKNPATFCGKAEAMLSVNGTLYAWVTSAFNDPSSADSFPCPKPPAVTESRLATSTDLGAHFTESSFAIVHNTGAIQPKRFINFGKDYAGARDGNIYMVGVRVTNSPEADDSDGKAYLIQVPIASIQDTSKWQYMTGLDANGVPVWVAGSAGVTAAQPMWSDTGFGFGGIWYHPATNRYLLVGKSAIQDLAIYDAPQPWGPWTIAFSTHTWGPSGSPYGTQGSLGLSLPEAWMSADGKTVWGVTSSEAGGPIGDSFNLLSATFTLNNHGVTVTSPLTYSQTQAAVGARLYSDRIYSVKTLSANLAGGELIQLANNDKASKAAAQVTFKLAAAATVYVAVDSTISPRASWLDATWTKDTTSVFTWNNEGDTVVAFDVYKKAFAAGTVSLPGNLTGTTGGAHSNYTVIVH